MAQTDDFDFANQPGLLFRQQANAVVAALVSSNSGSTAPDPTFPGMVWLDTSVAPPALKQRNAANDAWVSVASHLGLSARNLIINGSGRVNQEGYVSGTATIAANQYTLDQWYVITSGQSLTFTGDNSRRVMTAPAGGVGQIVEGRNIVGGTYVLNWDGTATATVNGSARTKGETFTLTANTNATIVFSGGTFTDAQLEAGAAVTPFEQRNYAFEELLCQRYWETGYVAAGARSGDNVAVMTAQFKATKRVAPAMSYTVINGGTVTPSIITVESAEFSNNPGSGGVGRVTWFANARIVP